MENYSYNSYAESGDSSPRSREIDFENPPPWDESQLQNQTYRVKFMCSYGGKIHPRQHDNLLSYVGGDTKIFAVDRNIKLSSMLAKLAALCDAEVTFKYQLPGEDLDALISVTNDDDLEHMMHEYDRLYRAPGKPARMRLFLFPANLNSSSFGSDGARSDRDRFVDVLNPGSSLGGGSDASKPNVPNKVDFLFGLDKGVTPPSPPAPVAVKLHDPVPEPVDQPLDTGIRPNPGDRISVSDPSLVHPAEIQRQLQELQRLQINEQEQAAAAAYRRKSEENLIGGYGGDYYLQKMMEKAPPQGYWQEKQVSSGGYPATVTSPEPPVYMISAPGSVYHTPQHPMVRPVARPPGQGYYAVQRMPTDVYREQPVYNMVQPPPQQFSAAPSPNLQQPQQPQKMTAYHDGVGLVRPISGGGGGDVNLSGDVGQFTQVAYDSTTGRQVYYTAGGGAMLAPPSPYNGIPAVVSGGEMRTSGVVGQDGKLVGKVSQGSV